MLTTPSLLWQCHVYIPRPAQFPRDLLRSCAGGVSSKEHLVDVLAISLLLVGRCWCRWWYAVLSSLHCPARDLYHCCWSVDVGVAGGTRFCLLSIVLHEICITANPTLRELPRLTLLPVGIERCRIHKGS